MSKTKEELIRQSESAPASERYTKDLEDMLKGFISRADWMLRCPICQQPWDRCPADAHREDCLIPQTKALLERTGYTDDF